MASKPERAPPLSDETRRITPLMEQIGHDCRQLADQLGLPYFHFVLQTLVQPGLPVQLFVDGGPAGFRQIFESGLDFSLDPVLRRSLQIVAPFEWGPALADDAEGASLQACATAGMKHGLAIPLHDSHGSVGVLSFGGPHPLPPSARQREELMRQAHWQAAGVFDRALAALRETLGRSKRRLLTPRQMQALVLASRGMVLAQIARELRVHPSTARYLVMRATQKMGVKTREEAIVRLAAMGGLLGKPGVGRGAGWQFYLEHPRPRKAA